MWMQYLIRKEKEYAFQQKKRTEPAKVNNAVNDTSSNDSKPTVKMVNPNDPYRLYEQYIKYWYDGDLETAYEYALKAAKAGDENGLLTYGIHYMDGDGVEVDKEKAFNAYKIGAELGGCDTQVQLARSYEQGEGTEVDIEKAIYWYL